MFRSPSSTPSARASRRVATSVVATVLFLALGVPFAFAQDTTTPLELSAVQRIENVADNRWRQRGLAYVDLPLGIRARFDASYSQHLYSSDVLAEPFTGLTGPGLRADDTLESRFALARPIANGIEIEIVWETRNSLETSDPMGFGRQTIGARIRISP